MYSDICVLEVNNVLLWLMKITQIYTVDNGSFVSNQETTTTGFDFSALTCQLLFWSESDDIHIFISKDMVQVLKKKIIFNHI